MENRKLTVKQLTLKMLEQYTANYEALKTASESSLLAVDSVNKACAMLTVVSTKLDEVTGALQEVIFNRQTNPENNVPTEDDGESITATLKEQARGGIEIPEGCENYVEMVDGPQGIRIYPKYFSRGLWAKCKESFAEQGLRWVSNGKKGYWRH